MTRWFRFYDDAVNDPKVQRLPGEKFKAWVNLLCLASKNGGVLPSLDDITFAMRVTRDDCVTLLDEFCANGLLDPVEVRDAPMSYEPHNWSERQYISDAKDPTSAERSRRYRERKRDATCRDRDAPVSVTATRADTDTDTETEQNRKNSPVAKATRTKQIYSEDFQEKFWKPYPRTPIMSKQEAWREWSKLDPEQQRTSCQALPAYLKHLAQNPTLQAVHACRFLSQKRAEGILEMASERPAFDARRHML